MIAFRASIGLLVMRATSLPFRLLHFLFVSPAFCLWLCSAPLAADSLAVRLTGLLPRRQRISLPATGLASTSRWRLRFERDTGLLHSPGKAMTSPAKAWQTKKPNSTRPYRRDL